MERKRNLSKNAPQKVLKNVPVQVQIKTGSRDSFSYKEETKYFGLLEDNRVIDFKRVELFVAKIEEGRYYDEYPVMCFEAANLADLEKKITDFDGKEIPADKLADYLIIVDGQHRVAAFITYNERNPDKQKAVPNVNIIKADSSDDVLKFLVAINTAGKDWSDSDRWHIARNLNDESVNKINWLIKKFGFNQSTAQKIYLGRRLSKKEFSSMLNGNITNIEVFNDRERIEIGDKFIEICLQLSGYDETKMKLFSKRYFIDGFDDFSKGKSFEKVLEVIKKLNYEDLKKIGSTDDFVMMLKKAK